MAKTSPTQRSLKHLREQGYKVSITEKWNAWAKIRQDAFNFIDLLTIGTKDCKLRGIIGVQTTSKANLSARKKKILGIPEAKDWIQSGGKIVLHGWFKPTGKRSWEVKSIELTIDDFNTQFIEPEA